MKTFFAYLIFICAAGFLVFLLLGCGNGPKIAAVPESEIVDKVIEVPKAPQVVYDIVITGGRVMDPETGFDSIADVGIQGDTIGTISEEPLEGHKIIDVSGLVVSPGFIDIMCPISPKAQSYIFTEYWKVHDGVTTNLWLHDGSGYMDRILETLGKGKHYVNAGVSTRLTDYLWKGYSTEEIKNFVRENIEKGALGLSSSPEYTPDVTTEQLIEYAKIAAELNVRVYLHLRHSQYDKEVEGVKEAVRIAEESGAGVHIFHINSTGGMYNMTEALQVLEDARGRGVDIDADVYAYSYWMSFLQSSRFRPGWQNNGRLSYEDLYYIPTGEYLTEEKFHNYRKNHASSLVLVPEGTISWDHAILPALEKDWVFIASDGAFPISVEDSANITSHPRDTGNFAETLKEARERNLDLMKILKKITIDPARTLESASREFSRRGRLQAGMIADITVFNFETVRGMGTLFDAGKKSAGIPYVLVAGELVIEDSELIDAYNGKFIIRE